MERLWGGATATFQIIGANDAPVITSQPATVRLIEHAPITLLYTATATDRDRADLLTYRVSGVDAASFVIDARTGELMLRTVPDYATQSHYEVQVVVTDSGGLSDQQTVTVDVAAILVPPAPPAPPPAPAPAPAPVVESGSSS
ncbi:MAG: cadherin repeat domain-containing protein, partial [Magnetococcales bacterium]|nr:cadherin repeat domain-containing protein [Magnetococcales bacterium]